MWGHIAKGERRERKKEQRKKKERKKEKETKIRQETLKQTPFRSDTEKIERKTERNKEKRKRNALTNKHLDASVSQGCIYLDNCTCCHTEIEAADQTFYLTQSLCTDTMPTSPSADLITPGAWQGSHRSVNF